MQAGLFFDEPLIKRKDARLRPMPTIPETGWRPSTEFPNLSAAKIISFDTETKDLRLDERGPGWSRGDSHIVGISIAAETHSGERGAWYFPIRHETETHFNMDARNVLTYADYALNTPTRKVGANLTYDIGCLAAEDVRVGGMLDDVQFAEALIDNEAFVGLEHLSRKYLNAGKVTEILYDWIRAAYPNTPETLLRREIYRSPPSLAGAYAIGDAWQPLDIFKQQELILRSEALLDVYRMECDLIPLMVAMRMRGVPVDVEKAIQIRDELQGELPGLFRQVRDRWGFNLESTSSANLGRFFEHVGLDVPRTKEGNHSVRKEWLAALEHPAGEHINLIREYEKMIGTFLGGYVIGQNIKGRLHPQFHQLHSEGGGTKVGRFSSSDPNLQNIPSRTKLGKRIRECFVHEQGAYKWRKFDYSQVHYRLLAHFATGAGADELRDSYINDPKMDYHMGVFLRVAPFMHWDVNNEEIVKEKRRPIKNVNFGLLYGQSAKSLAYKAGFSDAQAKEFFEGYHKGAPYVKPTMEAIAQEVQQFGYVTTLKGRRIRFHEWEPVRKDWDNPEKPLPYNAAIAKWGAGIRRAYEYRGVNYKFQGSEPDLMKTGMLNCWNSGVFNVTGVPHITVHDELDFSVMEDTPLQREAYDYIQRTMQNAIKLRVPVFVDESNGPSWGKAD